MRFIGVARAALLGAARSPTLAAGERYENVVLAVLAVTALVAVTTSVV